MGIYNPITSLFESTYQNSLVTKLGDPLQELQMRIDWSKFRPILEEVFPTTKNKKGGRPRMDPQDILKILILQKLYQLSDHATEFQIADRMNFQRL